jgi:hypothetical protein
MSKKAEPGSIFIPRARWRVRFAPALVLLAAACQERDRLMFPDPGDGIGPVTTIDQPNGADTTLDAGPEFFVQGRTIDQDGVDTVYFFVIGGNQSFHPFQPRPPSDTVRFGVPISTSGRSGQTMLVQIHGVDTQGNQGGTSTRRIIVR